MKIDIWSDIACPWCYIGKRRFEKALAAHPRGQEVTVTWHSFQLDPSIPRHYEGTELDYLVRRKGMAPEQVKAMLAMVTEQAAGEGLDYDFDALVVANSLTAHKLIHTAAAHGRAGEVKEALLAAHFVDGRDTGDVEELVAIGVAAGLTEEQVRAGLEDPQVAAGVQQDFDLARAIGINGVPFFVLDDKFAVSGAQQPEVFRQALDQAFAAASPLIPVAGQQDAACGPDGCALPEQ